MANMTFGVNLVPSSDNAFCLGNSNKKWKAYLESINGDEVGLVLLPSVSASDEGRMLRVVDGLWAAAPCSVLLSSKFRINDSGLLQYDLITDTDYVEAIELQVDSDGILQYAVTDSE